MLTHIQIRDFAIIDSVELELEPGLTVLTGETGAGKSILVDALLLATGGRAGSDVVRHGAERAEVTATFAVNGNRAVADWFAEQEIDSDECVVRRVIASDCRSRRRQWPTIAIQALRHWAKRSWTYTPNGISVVMKRSAQLNCWITSRSQRAR